MAMQLDEAASTINEFYAAYPGLQQVKILLREDPKEIWGEHIHLSPGQVPGRYVHSSGIFAVAASTYENAHDLRRTLRRELFGHFGLNTLTQRQKQNLLAGIVLARTDNDFLTAWRRIDQAYPLIDDITKAEELFCAVCETVAPKREAEPAYLESWLMVAATKGRKASLVDVKNVACFLILGLEDNSRLQLVFPVKQA